MRYSVKDNMDVAGRAISYGTGMSFYQMEAEKDCEVKRILDATGQFKFVDVSQCTPLACGNVDPQRRVGGILAGGSSSGSAQDILSAKVDVALGTDVGGSCRTPAIRAKIFGYKAKSTDIDRRGMAKTSSGLEAIGWLARDLSSSLQTLEALDSNSRGRWSGVIIEGRSSPLVDNISGAWLAEYLPEFFSNTKVYNGLFHKKSPKGFVRVYKKYHPESPIFRGALPTMVRGRILAGCRLAMDDDRAREKAISEYRSCLRAVYPEEKLLVTPCQPIDAYQEKDYDDRWLLVANILDRPALVLPLGRQGIQLVGRCGRSLHQLASLLMASLPGDFDWSEPDHMKKLKAEIDRYTRGEPYIFSSATGVSTRSDDDR